MSCPLRQGLRLTLKSRHCSAKRLRVVGDMSPIGHPSGMSLRGFVLRVILALLYTVVNAESSSTSPQLVEYFFFNAATGHSQWEDPGDVPYADENGNRYWLNDKREWVTHDTNAWRYLWVERWSDEHKRSYFYNQQTKQSTWTRPPDLAWQRVPVTAANAASMMPTRPSGAVSGEEAVTHSQPAEAATREAAPQATAGKLQEAPQSAAAA